MTKELESEQEKSALVVNYDASAVGYHAYWGPVLAEISQDFVKELALSDGQCILDAGAGSGSMLRYLLGTTNSTVVGTDLSIGMLSLAPAKALRAVMDSERLAFKPDTFDTALAMFVLFHLPDPITGLREIRRTLKEGGTVACTTWGADDPDFRALEVFDEVLDRHGVAGGRRAYACYDSTDTPDKCAYLLEHTGFDVVSVRANRMAHRWTIDHFVGWRTQVGYGRTRWESLDSEAQSAAIEEAKTALAKLAPDELVLRDEVVYSIGRAVT